MIPTRISEIAISLYYGSRELLQLDPKKQITCLVDSSLGLK